MSIGSRMRIYSLKSMVNFIRDNYSWYGIYSMPLQFIISLINNIVFSAPHDSQTFWLIYIIIM